MQHEYCDIYYRILLSLISSRTNFRYLDNRPVHPVIMEETNNLALSPAPVVAVRRREKGAMAAMRGLKQSNVRIGANLLSCLWQKADERVIRGVDYKRWHSDSVDNARGSGASVIVIGAGEAAIRSCDYVVKLADTCRPA